MKRDQFLSHSRMADAAVRSCADSNRLSTVYNASLARGQGKIRFYRFLSSSLPVLTWCNSVRQTIGPSAFVGLPVPVG